MQMFNKIRMRRDDSEIIYKYGYLMYRLLEESKVFTLIFDVNNNGYADFFDIFRPLRDLIPQANDEIKDIDLAKEIYAKKFNFSSLENNVSEEVINFFENISSNSE
eukprot:GHVR01021285.1.p1 GENE.GHVR01021285.1~~GHVR01021285.1.p1  ORF type:complete len:106 (+),score=10.30 GHVR01021285.1:3209-3526(+)